MNTVFLYAGQGAQKPGMGRDFYEEYETYRSFADRMFAENLTVNTPDSAGTESVSHQQPSETGLEPLENVLHYFDGEASLNCTPAADLKILMEEGPAEVLSRTEYTQVCMGIFAAGVTRLLAEQGIRPSAACGLSLGEYGALYSAGAFSEEDYVRLLAFRGRAMAEAAKQVTTAMTAVMGAIDGSRIREICENQTEGFAAAVNFNCPGQTVICGDPKALEEVEKKLKMECGGRCVRLKVSGPFHTKYMEPAGKALAAYFERCGLQIQSLQIPVTSNATGNFYQPEEDVKDLLVKQVQSSVYLENNLRYLIQAGYRNFIEIGPGRTMAGFLNRTAKAMGIAVNVQSIDTVEDFKKVVTGNQQQ